MCPDRTVTPACLTRRCSRPAAGGISERATQRSAAGLLNGRVVSHGHRVPVCVLGICLIVAPVNSACSPAPAITPAELRTVGVDLQAAQPSVTRCSVHHMSLEKARIRVVSGFPRLPSPAYSAAKLVGFPFACSMITFVSYEPTSAERWRCPACTEAERVWCTEHEDDLQRYNEALLQRARANTVEPEPDPGAGVEEKLLLKYGYQPAPDRRGRHAQLFHLMRAFSGRSSNG